MYLSAQPIFTNDNRLTQYGEFGNNVDINVYVYSIPKYTTPRWYIGNIPVSSPTKYVPSERAAKVNVIGWCLASSEHFFSYIQDENI
jgi:hypothetical protein